MSPRRRVLMLAYYFPPLGGAGVQRTLKFVKYLAPLGWESMVVSTRSRIYGIRDESLLAEIPRGTRVLRTPALPLLRILALICLRLRLRRAFTWLIWPDGGLGWAPFAFIAALRAARRERPAVVYSTSAPFGGHLVALLIARLNRLPWVADFRDEWTYNAALADQPRPLRALSRQAERVITARASRVVVAADYFQLEGLAADDARRVVILNGVDEEDVRAEGNPSTETFVLANVGTVYESFDPSIAISALAGLAERGLVKRERVEVRLVGTIMIPGFEPPPGIRTEVTGYVPHDQALTEMARASVLLLYRPRASLAPSGKLFEYLASGRPLLCLAHPDNLAARLVREWDAGVVADPHDKAAIADALLGLWQRWQSDRLPDQARVRQLTLERYSRRAGAEQLAQVLETAAGG